MKKIIWVLVALGALAVIAFLALNNPLGKLVKLAIENFGPEMVQAEVSVNNVKISATDGQGKLSGFNLGNPKGFKTDHAFKADNIEVSIEPASVTSDVVVFHKVLIDGPNIIYEKGDGGSNFDAIQHNVEAYLGEGGKKGKEDKGGKKVVIDTLIIRNAKINYNGKIDLSLPDIELHNIGKQSGGASPAQVTKSIITELNSKIILALANVAEIGKKVGGMALDVGKSVKGLLEK